MAGKITKQCTSCGRSDMTLTTFVNARTKKSELLCLICQGKRSAPAKRTVASYDDEIKELDELAKRFEQIAVARPKETQAMEGMGNMFQTPISLFGDLRKMIAVLEMQRLMAIIEEGGEAYLNSELKKALEKEDFETAAKIQAKLNELEADKKK
jgi:protein-arginine kinase activator protein McsA